MLSPQLEIQRCCPDFNLLIVVIGCTVGVIIVISNDQVNLPVRFIVIEFCNRLIYRFCNSDGFTRRSFRTIVEVNDEMSGFYGSPDEFRMIVLRNLSLNRYSNRIDNTC